MCQIDNIKFFEQLHKDYYVAESNAKERITLRNGILREIIPLMEHTTTIFSNKWSKGEYDDDLFQHLSEAALESIIPSWKPTGSSIEGYYRVCLGNCAQSYVNAEYRRMSKEELIDPQDTFFWGVIAGDEDPAIEPIDHWELPEHLSLEAYEFVKEVLLRGLVSGGRQHIIKVIKEDFNLSRSKALDVYHHALISCREMYANKGLDSELPEIESGSFFERLCEYLPENTKNEILRIFGGIWIRIPNGQEKPTYGE